MTMEYVTIDQVRAARQRDTEGELVNEHAYHRLSAQYVKLYDPPVNGTTPLNGAGLPSTSDVQASQALHALDKGFTEAPVTGDEAQASGASLGRGTLPDLRNYASEHEIDLGGARRKDEVQDIVFENLTVSELRDFARENDIELGDATRKADIIDRIKRSEPKEAATAVDEPASDEADNPDVERRASEGATRPGDLNLHETDKGPVTVPGSGAHEG